MKSYSILSEIESFLNEKEVDISSVTDGFNIPKEHRVKDKNNIKYDKDDLLNSVEEDEEQIEDEDSEDSEETEDKSEEEKSKEPDLTGNLEEEDIIMPNDLDPENGNVGEEFVRRFNILRATKSLKDKEIYLAFKKYYKSLTYEERISFYTFIVGMTQVCTNSLGGEEEGSKPSDYGISISYKNSSSSKEEDKEEDKENKKIKKKKKKQEPSRFQKKSDGIISVINTEGIQDKSEILDYLRKLNG